MYTQEIEKGEDENQQHVKSVAEFIESESEYKISRLIAKGGMSYIFLAKDLKCQRNVALKMMSPNKKIDEKMAQRFVEEAQITSQLDHPSIIPIHNLCKGKNGEPFYVMKYINGNTLADILCHIKTRETQFLKRYNIERLLNIFMKICDAMSYAASKHIVHRDLKPENIMIGQFDEVYIMDWGIAKVCNPIETKQLIRKNITNDSESFYIQTLSSMCEGYDSVTQENMLLGTPCFMAPEQLCSEFEIDPRVDIYSLGIILNMMITLTQPFQSMSNTDIFQAKLKGDYKKLKYYKYKVPHISSFDFPLSLQAVIDKALKISPKDRYQTCDALKEDVQKWMNGNATDAEAEEQFRLLKLLFLRHKRLVTVIILFVATICTVFFKMNMKLELVELEKEDFIEKSSFNEIQYQRTLLMKYQLEEKFNNFNKHISDMKQKIHLLSEGTATIHEAIVMSEQLVLIEPSVENYNDLIQLHIKNKNHESASNRLVSALNIYPREPQLLTLINEID